MPLIHLKMCLYFLSFHHFLEAREELGKFLCLVFGRIEGKNIPFEIFCPLFAPSILLGILDRMGSCRVSVTLTIIFHSLTPDVLPTASTLL